MDACCREDIINQAGCANRRRRCGTWAERVWFDEIAAAQDTPGGRDGEDRSVLPDWPPDSSNQSGVAQSCNGITRAMRGMRGDSFRTESRL